MSATPEATINTVTILKAIARVISVFGVWGWVDILGASILLFGCVGELWLLLNKLPEHNERRASLKGCWVFIDRAESIMRLIGVRLKIVRPRKFSDLKEHLLEGFFISLVAIGVGMEICSLPFSLKESADANLEAKQAGRDAAASKERAGTAEKEAKDAEVLAAQIGTTNAELSLNVEELRSNNIVLEYRLLPRTITPIQMTNFIFLMAKVEKIPITVHVGLEDGETINFARNFNAMLANAGFPQDVNGTDFGIRRDAAHPFEPGHYSVPAQSEFVQILSYNVVPEMQLNTEMTNGFLRPIVSQKSPREIYQAIYTSLNQIGIKTMWGTNVNWVKLDECEFFVPQKGN